MRVATIGIAVVAIAARIVLIRLPIPRGAIVSIPAIKRFLVISLGTLVSLSTLLFALARRRTSMSPSRVVWVVVSPIVTLVTTSVFRRRLVPIRLWVTPLALLATVVGLVATTLVVVAFVLIVVVTTIGGVVARLLGETACLHSILTLLDY